MTSKHTPGPWERRHLTIMGQTSVQDAYQKVASVHNDKSLENAEANARLIAAAPDMLAALVLAESYADVMGVMTVQAIRDAIAKATGGNK